MNPEKRERLPGMAFAGFVKRFTAPELSEGFQDITPVEFTVSRQLSPFTILPLTDWIFAKQFHGDENAQKAWAQHYVSK